MQIKALTMGDDRPRYYQVAWLGKADFGNLGELPVALISESEGHETLVRQMNASELDQQFGDEEPGYLWVGAGSDSCRSFAPSPGYDRIDDQRLGKAS